MRINSIQSNCYNYLSVKSFNSGYNKTVVFKSSEEQTNKVFSPIAYPYFDMSKAVGAKNFALNREIANSGKFIYDAMRDLNDMSGLNDDVNLFGFLYKASVGIERLQKVAYILMKNPDSDEYKKVEEEIRTHSHSDLQKAIKQMGGKEFPSNQNEFLRILDKFYKTYRYDKFNLDFDLDAEKVMFSDFINHNLSKNLKPNDFVSALIDEQTKKFLGRIIKKISNNYYEIIKQKSYELNLYTYELNPDSKSMIIFGNYDDKDLQRRFVDEQTARKELLLFLMNTKEKSGLSQYMKKIPPLDIDIALLEEYLPEMVKGNVPQGFLDELETIYMDMEKEQRVERRELLSAVANPCCYFDDEIEI